MGRRAQSLLSEGVSREGRFSCRGLKKSGAPVECRVIVIKEGAGSLPSSFEHGRVKERTESLISSL